MWKQCCGRKQQRGRKEVTVWQETATWRSPCSSVPSSSLYLPNRVPCAPFSRHTSGSEPGLLNGTKLCPLSSSQDSTGNVCMFLVVREFPQSLWPLKDGGELLHCDAGLLPQLPGMLPLLSRRLVRIAFAEVILDLLPILCCLISSSALPGFTEAWQTLLLKAEAKRTQKISDLSILLLPNSAVITQYLYFFLNCSWRSKHSLWCPWVAFHI